MFRWYQKAQICYVHLSDVHCTSIRDDWGNSFVRSKWFTRGWTLQELLAPRDVHFYNSSWQYLGDKLTLQNKITGINGSMLTDFIPDAYSSAVRMSWASRRVTTRVEDMAYCLLGISGVNMPLLHGEGERAFVRLQEEIMRISDDQSLFAWEITPEHPVHWNGVSCSSGLLAQSPTDFKSCSNISSSEDRWNRTPYSMTNTGLSSK
jgi:hypothetical protein